eukprot:scpid66264/ scgid9300/ 
MDETGNCPLRAKMMGLWVEWFRTQNDRTPNNSLKPPTRQPAIDWVSCAWDSVSSDSTKDSFVICGTTAAADGSQDDDVCRHLSLQPAMPQGEQPHDAKLAAGADIVDNDHDDNVSQSDTDSEGGSEDD